MDISHSESVIRGTSGTCDVNSTNVNFPSTHPTQITHAIFNLKKVNVSRNSVIKRAYVSFYSKQQSDHQYQIKISLMRSKFNSDSCGSINSNNFHLTTPVVWNVLAWKTNTYEASVDISPLILFIIRTNSWIKGSDITLAFIPDKNITETNNLINAQLTKLYIYYETMEPSKFWLDYFIKPFWRKLLYSEKNCLYFLMFLCSNFEEGIIKHQNHNIYWILHA